MPMYDREERINYDSEFGDKPKKTFFGNTQHIVPQQGWDNTLNYLTPHYSDNRFRHAQLIWGLDKASNWDYSDRLQEWDYDKWQISWEKASKKASLRSAKFYQALLQIYFGKSRLKLTGIASGWNWSTGYPYLVFGYK